jgi:hypothetical protein
MKVLYKGGRFGFVAAVVALALACTGSAVAVSKITSKDVKDGSLQAKDLSKKAKKALRGLRGPAGAKGPQGAPGTPGAPGAPGAAGKNAFDTIYYVDSVADNEGQIPDEVQPGDEIAVSAHCPAGTIPISGGFDYFTLELDNDGNPVPGTVFSDPDMVVNYSGANDDLPESSDPNTPSGDGTLDSWGVIVYSGGANDPGFHDFVVAFAHCAKATAEFPQYPDTAKKKSAGFDWRALRR